MYVDINSKRFANKNWSLSDVPYPLEFILLLLSELSSNNNDFVQFDNEIALNILKYADLVIFNLISLLTQSIGDIEQKVLIVI